MHIRATRVKYVYVCACMYMYNIVNVCVYACVCLYVYAWVYSCTYAKYLHVHVQCRYTMSTMLSMFAILQQQKLNKVNLKNLYSLDIHCSSNCSNYMYLGILT